MTKTFKLFMFLFCFLKQGVSPPPIKIFYFCVALKLSVTVDITNLRALYVVNLPLYVY